MAVSKSGGTRTYIRGRVGSDVYSIGRNAKGKRQQVVRSLAEQVANPQTAAQMRGRCIMATVMQAMSAMTPIINHSWTGLKAGQPCLSAFIAANYKLVKDDAAANPVSGNEFGINKYQEKGAKQGAYQISDGNGADLLNVTFDPQAKTLTIAVGESLTPASLRAALGIGVNDKFTLCLLSADGKFYYERARVYADMAASQEITAENISEVFTMEGNNPFTASISGQNIVLTFAEASANYGIIVSRKVDEGYKYNKCVLAAVTNPAWNYQTAIATFPEGTGLFLQGGNDAVVATQGGSSEPSEETYSGQITALAAGADSLMTGSVGAWEAPRTITGTISAVPSKGNAALYFGATKVGDITGTSFTFNNVSAVVGKVTLKYNNETIQTLAEITTAGENDG